MSVAGKVRRCDWAGDDRDYQRYHDKEWGIPVRGERKLFEMLTLEGAQAGLSWITILKKRAHYRRVFANFDPKKVARFDRRKVERLLKDPGIVRNRLKVESTVSNARALLRWKDEEGSFARGLWDLAGGETRINRWKTMKQVPAKTPVSDRMSKELKRRGFRFVGSTICYAFMQACGMVNDHLVDCDRYRECCDRAWVGE